jgi:hypothetical protein
MKKNKFKIKLILYKANEQILFKKLRLYYHDGYHTTGNLPKTVNSFNWII